ncbi:argininosuccinate lyase [Flavobacterium sp. U410]
MGNKIWQKKSTENLDHAAIIEKFTVGNDTDFDMLLAEFDVLGSLAHTKMLNSIGLISDEEWIILEKELNTILGEIELGKFQIEEGIEDIHSQIEFMLTQRIGEIGKKIHSGRSRNDQVLTDLKLFLKHELGEVAQLTTDLFEQLIALGDQYKKVLLPGYTHLQIAMPSSFGLWFSAYAEALTDDMEFLVAAYNVTNKNPLGSGAGYGSSFPLNRKMTTELLNFADLNYNVVYAQMTRGKSEKAVAMALSSIAATLSKFSYDVCLYMNQNFGFLSFPDSLTTGSSIMPHKKNPDVFELIRAKCNRIQAIPNELALLTNNLPSGYHRDWQLTKECLFPGIEALKDCLSICKFMLNHIIIKDNILDDEKYKYLFSVENVNQEVLNGMSFREAYKKIGLEIENNTYEPITNLNHTHEGSIGNLCLSEIKSAFYAVRSKVV